MQSKSGAHAHKLVYETATAMAHECYDALMQRDAWYTAWKASHPGLGSRALEARWVSLHRADFIEGARAILAGMLAQPIEESLKAQIHEALCLDHTLVRGRKSGVRQLRQGKV